METLTVMPTESLLACIKQAVAEALEKDREKNKVDTFFSVKDVCKIFTCSKPTIYSYVRKNLLTPHKLGTRTFFKKSEIDSSVIKKYARQ